MGWLRESAQRTGDCPKHLPICAMGTVIGCARRPYASHCYIGSGRLSRGRGAATLDREYNGRARIRCDARRNIWRADRGITGGISAPIPGLASLPVVAVLPSAKREAFAWTETMKGEAAIRAEYDGIWQQVHCVAEATVSQNDVLIERTQGAYDDTAVGRRHLAY